MKKKIRSLTTMLLLAALLTGCSAAGDQETVPSTEPATVAPSTATTEAPAPSTTEATEEYIVYEGDASSYYIDKVYHEQIARYSAPLSEKWDEGKYYENELSPLPAYYYEGNPLENVGFGFVDLDRDGSWELIIGAIQNAENDPAVFEIWTLVDGEPLMLAQAGNRNRYVLQYVLEDNMWYVVNEGSGSAYNHVTYYLMLNEGKFEVVQGIIFDAMADEQNPWFLTYDLDQDVSNDTPIDEDTANAILDSHRVHYTALEYFPYIFF